jgi:hypothetical protein
VTAQSDSHSGLLFARFSRDAFSSPCPITALPNGEWSLSYFVSESPPVQEVKVSEVSADSLFDLYSWGTLDPALSSGILAGYESGLSYSPFRSINPAQTGSQNTLQLDLSASYNITLPPFEVSAWVVSRSDIWSPGSYDILEDFGLGSGLATQSGIPSWISGAVPRQGETNGWGIAQMALIQNIDTEDHFQPAAYALIVGSDSWKDTVLSVELVSSSSNAGAAGVLVRFQDLHNFYGAVVKWSPEYVATLEVYRVMAGVRTTLCPASTLPGYSGGDPLLLSFRANGDDLDVTWENQQQTCSVADNSFFSGSTGFFHFWQLRCSFY